MVERLPSPPRPILESSVERHSPFDLCHLADSLPSPLLSPAPSVDGSPWITAGRLPFPLVLTASSQQGLSPEAQTVSPKKRSGKASRAPRVDNQMTKAGKVSSTWNPSADSSEDKYPMYFYFLALHTSAPRLSPTRGWRQTNNPKDLGRKRESHRARSSRALHK